MSINRERIVSGKCAVQTSGSAADLFPYGEQPARKIAWRLLCIRWKNDITHCFN
jgi:hypothetical protein